MFYGLIRLASRIKWWLTFSLKTEYHHCFCINCKYFDVCKEENEHIKTVFGEVVE